MSTAIINDINKLSKNFRKKFDPRRAEVLKKYPNAQVFETLRTQERQNYLYTIWRTIRKDEKPVTWTLDSNHKNGNAVDIIFWGKREWPYLDVIEIAKKYGIRNLHPKETCHFEDDGKPYNPIDEKAQLTIAIRQYMKLAGDIRNLSSSQVTKDRMTSNNDYFRQFWY
jgi:hypothetical protein